MLLFYCLPMEKKYFPMKIIDISIYLNFVQKLEFFAFSSCRLVSCVAYIVSKNALRNLNTLWTLLGIDVITYLCNICRGIDVKHLGVIDSLMFVHFESHASNQVHPQCPRAIEFWFKFACFILHVTILQQTFWTTEIKKKCIHCASKWASFEVLDAFITKSTMQLKM